MISGFSKNSIYLVLATAFSIGLTSYATAETKAQSNASGQARKRLEANTNGLSLGGTETVTLQRFAADLTAGSICNDGSSYGTTGALRLELFAFPQPFFPGENGSYKLAESNNQPGLSAGFCYNNFDSGSVAILQVPPDGIYYVAMFLEMYTGYFSQDDGFNYFDYVRFPNTLTVSGGVMYFNGGCTSDATTLCLNSGRFRVVTTYLTPAGASGPGQAVAITGDTGYFWFFSSNNVEMVLKVVDGRVVNNHYWVFAGGLTNVRVVTTVTDTLTGAVRTYVNPLNTAFLPLQDTSAFVGP